MTPVDALLFDLDGTLIDSQQDLAEAVRHIQKHYQLPLSDNKTVGTFIGDGVVRLVERAVPGLSDALLDEAVERFKKFYQEHCLDHTVLCEGALLALKHFQKKKLAVVTNKPERISRRILKGLHVDSFFAVVIGGDSLPKKKPDPLPLQHALSQLGNIDPDKAVMVGDGINDILAGKAAGIITCDLDSTISHSQAEKTHKPDFKIQALPELMRLFS